MPTTRVRMYRHGLGGCFLLTFVDGPETRHLLIDFGVLMGTHDAAETMSAVAADIVAVTGGRLDAAAVTHEHWDHVSGFVQAAAVLAPLEITEAWLAWTEKRGDEVADGLREHRLRLLRAATGAQQALAAADPDRAALLADLLAFTGGLAANGRPTTADALRRFVDLAGPRPPRYLTPGENFSAFGVRVYVLGPPRDPAWLRISDPRTSQHEVYEHTPDDAALGLVHALDPAGEPADGPFEQHFRCAEADLGPLASDPDGYTADDQRWRRIDQDWLHAADQLALRLDSDTNNTSLVLALELGDGGPVLLFTGDAQVGNWLSWQTVTFETATGTVEANDLLARTVLYKVGHHGSHNATLSVAGLERMTSTDLIAMIPVDQEVGRSHKWKMPFGPLHERLRELTEGRILVSDTGLPQRPEAAVHPARWDDFVTRTDVQDRWIDLTFDW